MATRLFVAGLAWLSSGRFNSWAPASSAIPAAMLQGFDFQDCFDDAVEGPATAQRAGPPTAKRSRTGTHSTPEQPSTHVKQAPSAPTARSASADEELTRLLQQRASIPTKASSSPSGVLVLATANSDVADSVALSSEVADGKTEIKCGVCGSTPSAAPWCYEACLGGQVTELTSACTLCVTGVQVVCPSLSWAQAEQLACVSQDFKRGIPMVGKIQQALVPTVRTQQQFMVLVGGGGSHGREVGDTLSRICDALGVRLQPSDPSSAAGDDLAEASGAEAERRFTPTKAGSCRVVGARRARVGSGNPEVGPNAFVAIGSKGQVEPASPAESDKNSFAYHNKKVNLAAILSGAVPRAGNLINAVEKSARVLREDRTGLRRTEGAALTKLARWAAAADMLTEKRQRGLDHPKFMFHLGILKEARMDSYPPTWCRLVWRRMLMQIEDTKAFLDMVAVWCKPDEGCGFDPLKPQLLSLPLEDPGHIIDAFADAIIGDLMTDAMRPPLLPAKVGRMWCIAQELYTALQANSAVATERVGKEAFEALMEIATVNCAVAALLPGEAVDVEQRPQAANMQTKSIMAALKGLRDQAPVTGGESPTHRQQVGELFRQAPWDGMADAFLTLVLTESQHVGRRDGLIAKLGEKASKEEVSSVAAALREWHESTREVWLQPLASACHEFALRQGETAKTSDSVEEVCLARFALEVTLELISAKVILASPAAAENLLRTIGPQATALEEKQDELKYVELSGALSVHVAEGTATKEHFLETKTWPRWTTTPAQVTEAFEVLASTIFVAAAEDPKEGEVADDGPMASFLVTLEELLEVTAIPDRRPMQECLRLVKSYVAAKSALASLMRSKSEPNQKTRSSMVKAAIKALQETQKTMQLEALAAMEPVLTRLGAECVMDSVRKIIPQRETVLGDHLLARKQHCEGALVAATAELKRVNQGGIDGQSWYSGIDSADFSALVGISSSFFAHFSTQEAQTAMKKTSAAVKAYKEVLDAAVGASPVAAPACLADAVEAIERAQITMNEAYLMAAVCTGGEEGRNQCRTCLDGLVSGTDFPLEKVQPALLKEVYRLLGQK